MKRIAITDEANKALWVEKRKSGGIYLPTIASELIILGIEYKKNLKKISNICGKVK